MKLVELGAISCGDSPGFVHEADEQRAPSCQFAKVEAPSEDRSTGAH